jgi:hypothetical protein
MVEFFRLELQGVIQAFEVSQSYLGKSSESFKDQGTDYLEAKNVLLGSFNVGLSTNGTIWFDMIKVKMTLIFMTILKVLAILDTGLSYVTEFKVFENKMQSLV